MENIIKLLPKQTTAFNYYEDPAILELGYGGGAGGGKTKLGCYLALFIAEKYPGSVGLIGRKELKVLRLTTIASLFETLAGYNYKKDIDYTYHAQDSKLVFTNGSAILFVDTSYSPQDPEYTRFGSYEITWAWIDESNETPLKAKQILKTRVGRKNNIGGEVVKPFWLETFNPDKGHVYADYYKPWKDSRLPVYRAFVRALPADNPYLPTVYIENLKRADKITRERLLEGNFDYDADDNTLIRHDYIEDLFTNVITKEPRKYITVDVARYGGDKTVISVWDDFEMIDIGMFSGLGIDMTANKIREYSEKHKIPYSHILVDEDGVGGGVVDILRGVKGFMANRSCFPNRISGKPDNFANLKTQCCYYLADWINSHRMSVRVLDENIKENIRIDLSWIKRKNPDQDGKLYVIGKDEIKEAIGRSPDVGDTMMMRMYFELEKPSISRTNHDPIAVLIQRRMTERGGNQLDYK